MHLTVIAKAPVAGRVKTRLCPPLTPDQACAVARAALAESLAAVIDLAAALRRDHACNHRARAALDAEESSDAPTGGLDIEPVLLLDGERQDWMPAMRTVPQRGRGLDERLAYGFADLGPGIIVGMETPHMIPALAAGFAALARGADVLAPATDGGYWAIGLAPPAATDPLPRFAGVPMSTSRTGIAQLRRLHAAGRPVALLPAARDLDDIDDLRSIARSPRTGVLADLARHLLRSPGNDSDGHRGAGSTPTRSASTT